MRKFNNKKTFAFLSTGLLLVSLSGCAKSDTLPEVQNEPTAENPREILISTNSDSNPDSFIDENGAYTGFEPEMLKAIDELLPEYTFKYTSISSTDALLALENGRSTLLFSVGRITNPGEKNTSSQMSITLHIPRILLYGETETISILWRILKGKKYL